MLVNRDGQRVDLTMIEAVLNEHPQIRDSVVTAHTITPEHSCVSSIHLSAFIVFSDNQLSFEGITEHLRASLSDACIPDAFYKVNDITLTSNGKINKQDISKQAKQKINPTVVPATSPLEKKLLTIWQNILKHDDIGITMSFRNCGGKSLVFMDMLREVEASFNIELVSQKNFDIDMTIQTLTQHVQTAKQNRNIRFHDQTIRYRTNMIPSDKVVITLVGGGPTAVSLCAQLLLELKDNPIPYDVEINVFEKSGSIGAGLPYSQQEDCYIVNLPKDVMGYKLGDTGQFSQWLQKISTAPQETNYPPRYYFGQYLEEMAAQLPLQGRCHGITLKYHTHHEVIDIEKLDDDLLNVKTLQTTCISHYIVLCTGHLPVETYREFIGTPGYYHDFWQGSRGSIDKHDDVIIMGTRLTAIDYALKLHSEGHKGKIKMVSPSGMLPTVLGKTIPSYSLQYLTPHHFNVITKCGLKPLELTTLLELFWKEMEVATGQTINFDTLKKSYRDITPIDWLNQEIEQSEKGAKIWQQVLFAIYPISSDIWSMLTPKDQIAFLRKYNGTYMTYLAAFPLENAYRIRHLMQSGQLEVHGGLLNVSKHPDGFAVQTQDHSFFSKYLLNATGYGYDIRYVPLYHSMMQNKLIYPHLCGGIYVNPKTLRITKPDGHPVKNMMALGELTRGVCLATTDMGRVSMQANRVAYTIRCDMSQRKRVSSRAHRSQKFYTSLPKNRSIPQFFKPFLPIASHKGLARGIRTVIHYMRP